MSAMEEADPPECPVCLQPYDAVSYIPRVLACGHTTCEVCLKQFPNPFPNTIRCSICTLLVKCPNPLSSLPKNLDLLHFSSVLQNRAPTKDRKVTSSSLTEGGDNQSNFFQLTLKSWSYEFHGKWKKWILPQDCVAIEKVDSESDDGMIYGKVLGYFNNEHGTGNSVLSEKDGVGLVKVGTFEESAEDSVCFKYGYESRIMTVLSAMKEEKGNKLETILNATFRVNNVGKAYGFWYNGDDMCVYIVFQKFGLPKLMECFLKEKKDEEGSLSTDEMSGFGILGMEICEILSCLHVEGIVIGFLTPSCFSFTDFGHVYLDFCEILNVGRRITMILRRTQKDSEVGLKIKLLDENSTFISPEMLLQRLVKEEQESDRGNSKYEIGCASDVWSLACILVWLIVGGSFMTELRSFFHSTLDAFENDKGCDFPTISISMTGKIKSLLEVRLGSEFVHLKEILLKCLDFVPENRPAITEVWKCLRELVIKPQFDMQLLLKTEVKKESFGPFLILGEPFWVVDEMEKELMGRLEGKDEIDRADVDLRTADDVVGGISNGHFKCTELKGHLDCVTGLAVGGNFLFSSSYDKTVKVWSLQNFTHIHSFKGHEHRIMALAFVNGEEPLCISGDYQGVICIWKADIPFSDAPIHKLDEKKDWRYSGIHAMAISGREYLYTGSGDKLVKAWLLQDYTLSCAMSGHKSVVSSLITSNGILYSGSWDGTIRLWSLSDHSPLAVLGEDKIGDATSVSSITVEKDMLFAVHANGSMKIWRDDVLVKHTQPHKGAVFSVCKKGRMLFTGGWDKTLSVQETSEDPDGLEVRAIGSIACSSTITALTYWQGKLFVGQADKVIKVYHG